MCDPEGCTPETEALTSSQRLYAEGYELVDIAVEADRHGDVVNAHRFSELAKATLRAAHDANPILSINTILGDHHNG